jgi:hypothetical protein
MWKMSWPYLDRRSWNQNFIFFPPAFAIASPSLDPGEAMAKVGGRIPLVEPELSPVPCFLPENRQPLQRCSHVAGGGLPSRFSPSRLKQP